MRNLPSEQTKLVQEALHRWAEMPEKECFYLDEPCDCGSMIRHNNGGNYHEEISFCKDSGKIFAKYGSSSEFVEAEWKEISNERVIEEIRSHSDWL